MGRKVWKSISRLGVNIGGEESEGVKILDMMEARNCIGMHGVEENKNNAL